MAFLTKQLRFCRDFPVLNICLFQLMLWRDLNLVLYNCYHWNLLTELLKQSPNLESLVVKYEDEECVEDYEEREEDLVFLYSEHRWSTPESVPICLISHLKTVTTRGFKGYPHEQKVVKYLPKNGKVLDKMIIYRLMGFTKN